MQIENEPAAELLCLVEAHRAEILADACRSLHRAHLKHYEAAGAAACAERLERLLDLVVASIRDGSLVPVVRHAECVALQRYAGGFDFREVHAAFNVLEEAIWHQVATKGPHENLAVVLGLLSTVLGAAKEALAAEYVALATKQHALAFDLTTLFEGYEGAD